MKQLKVSFNQDGPVFRLETQDDLCQTDISIVDTIVMRMMSTNRHGQYSKYKL